MPVIIGLDEAGLGPNLGPLVLTATVWKVPALPPKACLWKLLGDAVTAEPTGPDDRRLHVADSKVVYSPARGLAALERGVLALLHQAGMLLSTLGAQIAHLAPPRLPDDDLLPTEAEPWFAELNHPLVMCEAAKDAAEHLRICARTSQVSLLAVRSRVIFAPEFNCLIQRYDNKALVLSTVALQLLASVWSPDTSETTLIISDKHGGRSRYDALLQHHFPDAWFTCERETAEESIYRAGKSTLRFQPRGEEWLPVAASSMICKYLRERAMDALNAWWLERLPEVRPTKGYPTDAQRFRREIAPYAAAANLPESLWWRCR